MAKKFVLLLFLISAMIAALSQEFTREYADSIRIALKKSSTDLNRIDLLLSLAQFYVFKPGEFQVDFDSARRYINEAQQLNKKVQSRDVMGYILLTESSIIKELGDWARGEEMNHQALKILEPGTNKTYLGRAYYRLSEYYDYKDSLENFKKIELVEKAIATFELTSAWNDKGRALEMLGDVVFWNAMDSKAMSFLQRALAAYDSAKNKRVQGVYVLMAQIYQNQKQFGKALFYYLKALTIVEAIQDTGMTLCQIYNNIGSLYKDIWKLEVAIKYYHDALQVAVKNKNQSEIPGIARNLAQAYYLNNQSEQSLQALSLISNEVFKSNRSYVLHLTNAYYLRAYCRLRQYDNARPYFQFILDNVNKNDLATGDLRYIAEYYNGIGQYSKARNYLAKSIEYCKKNNLQTGLMLGLRVAYEIDSAQGNYRSAFNYLSQYKAKNDSLFSENTQRQFELITVDHALGLKEDSIKIKDNDIALLTERSNLQQANLRQARLMKNVTIVGILLAIIIIGLIYRQYKLKQKSNIIISGKNKMLEHLVTEKDWLVKEVHHRVKNNLQTVMSLLGTQSNYLKDDVAIDAINDSHRRIQSMSLIHQRLYQSNNLSAIKMNDYVHELVNSLSDSFDINKNIQFRLSIEAVELNLAHCIPIGLILNEAITNCFKYAFPADREGVITISLKRISHNSFLLIINDNGVGLPPDFHVNSQSSMGMNLMRGLSTEMGAQFSVSSDNGTRIDVNFTYVPENEVKATPPETEMAHSV